MSGRKSTTLIETVNFRLCEHTSGHMSGLAATRMAFIDARQYISRVSRTKPYFSTVEGGLQNRGIEISVKDRCFSFDSLRRNPSNSRWLGKVTFRRVSDVMSGNVTVTNVAKPSITEMLRMFGSKLSDSSISWV